MVPAGSVGQPVLRGRWDGREGGGVWVPLPPRSPHLFQGDQDGHRLGRIEADHFPSERETLLIRQLADTADGDSDQSHVSGLVVSPPVSKPPGEGADHSPVETGGFSDGAKIRGTTSLKNRHSISSAFSAMDKSARRCSSRR